MHISKNAGKLSTSQLIMVQNENILVLFFLYCEIFHRKDFMIFNHKAVLGRRLLGKLYVNYVNFLGS